MQLQVLLLALSQLVLSLAQSSSQPTLSSGTGKWNSTTTAAPAETLDSDVTEQDTSEIWPSSSSSSTLRTIPKAASGPVTARPQNAGAAPRPPSVNPTSIPKLVSSVEASSTQDLPPIPAPSCKTVVGDSLWPAASVWEKALPNVKAVAVIGRDAHPNYFLAARSINEVREAIKFVDRYHVRLSIISSGQDYLGRNNAPNGLLLSVKYLKGIRLVHDFEARQYGDGQVDFRTHPADENLAPPPPNAKTVVSFGAGVTTQELNDALESAGLFTVGPAAGDISAAGGWSQGGGHGPLSSTYGLGADQVLEYQVITADGELRIANAVTNSDLFWALKGAGGGTFGVVVQATVKTYSTPRIALSTFWFNTTSNNTGDIYPAAAYLHSQFPQLNTQGIQGYYFIYPQAIHGIFLAADKTAAAAKRLWTPVLQRMRNFAGMSAVIQEHTTYRNFKEFFDATFGMLNQTDYETDEKCKRKLDWHPGLFECQWINATTAKNVRYIDSRRRVRRQRPRPQDVLDPRPAGKTMIDSQLLGASHLQDTRLASALEAAMPRSDKGELLPDAVIRGYLTAGVGVMKQSDSSVHPSWRRAYLLLESTNLTSIRAISPDMGSYLDEGYFNTTDWKNLFWGSNYDQLIAIKKKYDPGHLFFTAPGVGADYWLVDRARLCRNDNIDIHAPIDYDNISIPYIPQSDNQNYIRNRNYTSLLIPWPDRQAVADANAFAARQKLSSLRDISARMRPTSAAARATNRPNIWRPTQVLTPITVTPKLPEWTPAADGDVPWGGFTAVPTDMPRSSEH